MEIKRATIETLYGRDSNFGACSTIVYGIYQKSSSLPAIRIGGGKITFESSFCNFCVPSIKLCPRLVIESALLMDLQMSFPLNGLVVVIVKVRFIISISFYFLS